MTAREKESIAQRIIARTLARSTVATDGELVASVRGDIENMPAVEIEPIIVLVRRLRTKITDSMPLLKREVGGLWELDDNKCARFEEAILREYPGVDRQALSHLLFWSWYHNDAR